MPSFVEGILQRSVRGEFLPGLPGVDAVRRAGPPAVWSVYALGWVVSVAIAFVGNISEFLYFLVWVVLWALWAAIGVWLVAVGTRLSHQVATWGVGLVASIIAILNVLSVSVRISELDSTDSGLSEAVLALLVLMSLVVGVAALYVVIKMHSAMRVLSVPVGTPFVVLPPVFPEPPTRSEESSLSDGEPQLPAAIHEPVPSGPVPVPSGPVYPYPYPYVVQVPVMPRRTNGLAIAALISSFFFAPIGVILGHVALVQIKRTHEDGRGLAIGALIVGYGLTLMSIVSWIVIVILYQQVTNSWEEDLSEATTTYETTPESTDPFASAIRSVSVGDCVHWELSGNTLTEFYKTDCDASDANAVVREVTDATYNCDGRWVRTTDDYDTTVLCLAWL